MTPSKVAVIAIALLIAACTPEAQVTKVQALTAKICGFVPAASAVASLLSAGNPAVVSVASIATAVCSAYTARPHALFGYGESAQSKDDCVVVVEGICVPGEPVGQ